MSRYLTHREWWACFVGLWIVVLVARSQLDGLPRWLVTAGATVAMVSLAVERFRNWRAHRPRARPRR